MSLEKEYKRQLRWRSWTTALDASPPLEGRTVLDLGCAAGDLAALLAARGAHVIGIDSNPELLAAARSREIANVEFRQGDAALVQLGTRQAKQASSARQVVRSRSEV